MLPNFEMLRQPDDVTCGPTCLHAVYRYYGDPITLDEVIADIHMLDEGGTLAVVLGIHALRRGYRAKLYTYNLKIFDPTWFAGDSANMLEKLASQIDHKPSRKLAWASKHYMEFLRLGGALHMEDLTTRLIRDLIAEGTPVLTGLSSTYLYQTKREFGLHMIPDDIKGVPQGHFVVITSYNHSDDQVTIADPYHPNPNSEECMYAVNLEHLVCSILLGVVTYDGNLLVIEK